MRLISPDRVCEISEQYAAEFLPANYVFYSLLWRIPSERAITPNGRSEGEWLIMFINLNEIADSNSMPTVFKTVVVDSVTGEAREPSLDQ